VRCTGIGGWSDWAKVTQIKTPHDHQPPSRIVSKPILGKSLGRRNPGGRAGRRGGPSRPGPPARSCWISPGGLAALPTNFCRPGASDRGAGELGDVRLRGRIGMSTGPTGPVAADLVGRGFGLGGGPATPAGVAVATDDRRQDRLSLAASCRCPRRRHRRPRGRPHWRPDRRPRRRTPPDAERVVGWPAAPECGRCAIPVAGAVHRLHGRIGPVGGRRRRGHARLAGSMGTNSGSGRPPGSPAGTRLGRIYELIRPQSQDMHGSPGSTRTR
jgi:hypothetical protein